MKLLITGSSGHLGEALMRTLQNSDHQAIGLDIKPGPFTQLVGSIVDREFVRNSMRGVNAVIHAATLHKPHVVTHSAQEFVDTNITGTLNLLEEAVSSGVTSFIYTSTTSAFGRALIPPPGKPAAWITEDVGPVPKNIYGVTKVAAESLCEMFHYKSGMPCLVLRTSRFFPEEDDDKRARESFDDANLKVNELLYRRGDVEDMVSAHLLAVEKAPGIGFRRYIISATTLFARDDLRELRVDVPAVVKRYVPEYESEYARRGWKLPQTIDRVYINELARTELGWQPRHDFPSAIRSLRAQEDFRSTLARAVGSKGYHAITFSEGPYPTT
jgi:nucleoside-diphosphate-sugar epimerase